MRRESTAMLHRLERHGLFGNNADLKDFSVVRARGSFTSFDL